MRRRESRLLPALFAAAELIQHLLQPLARIVLLENSSPMMELRQMTIIVLRVVRLAILVNIQGPDQHHVVAAMLEHTW